MGRIHLPSTVTGDDELTLTRFEDHGNGEQNSMQGMHFASLGDWPMVAAYKEIKDKYDVTARFKGKTLLKFGRTTNADTNAKTTLMELPGAEINETYLANDTNTISKVSSSSTSDTTSLTLEGHTDSGGVKTFVVQTVTLNGQNKVTLSTPLNRCTRMYNSGATDFVGNIYAYVDGTISAGVPSVASTVKCMIAAGENQSLKAASALSQWDYYVITEIMFGITRNAGSTVEADCRLEVREAGGVFLPKFTIPVSKSGGTHVHDEMYPHIVVPANADFRLITTADADNVTVVGYTNGYLCLDQACTDSSLF